MRNSPDNKSTTKGKSVSAVPRRRLQQSEAAKKPLEIFFLYNTKSVARYIFFCLHTMLQKKDTEVLYGLFW